MKTEKRVLRIAVDIQPLSYPGQMPNIYLSNAEWNTSVYSGAQRRIFEVSVDIPINYDAIPASDVKEAAP